MISKNADLTSFSDLLAECQVKETDINALSLYKLARKSFLNGNLREAQKYALLNKLFCSSIIPPEASICETCEFAYNGLGVLIHKDSVIHSFCNIGTHVVIGGNAASRQFVFDENNKKSFAPRLLDNVFVATGAKILGGIEIGKYTIIGANSVITKPIPSFSVVAGNPAKVIAEITPENITKYKGFFVTTRSLTWEGAQDFIARIARS